MEVGQIYELRFFLSQDESERKDRTILKGRIMDKNLDGTEIHLALFAPWNQIYDLDVVWVKVSGGACTIAYYYDEGKEPACLTK